MHIVDFSVSNFRSVKNMQTLSLLATNLKEFPENLIAIEKKLSVLKTCVLYGANAAGKSNILKALETMCQFVANSATLKPERRIHYYEPYRLEAGCDKLPCEMELEFVVRDGTRYLYKIAFDGEKVISEELSSFGSSKRSSLFTRRLGKKMKFGTSLKGRKRGIEDELLPNHLFLSKAALSNHTQLLPVFKFFESCISFSRRDTEMVGGVLPLTTMVLVKNDEVEFSPSLKEKVFRFLRAADTGIEGLEVRRKDVNINVDELPETIAETLKMELETQVVTKHSVFSKGKKCGDCYFDLRHEESTGTYKMYKLAGTILKALEIGGVVVLDELDSDIHPLVSRMIIAMFHNERTNPHNAQLIASTHDVTTLDLEIFRRDQIWFVEKNKGKETEIYSLVEFKKSEVRKETPLVKWYLAGRFGALPIIDPSCLFLKESNAGC